MKQNLLHFQPLPFSDTNRYVPEPATIQAAVNRLKMLMPEIPSHDLSSLSTVALRYVQQYRDDVLQLEIEWEVLYAALVDAWQSKDYASVVPLVAGMARSVGRICSLTEAERLLHMGIEASLHIEDNQHYIYFLNRLGNLLFSRGSYWLGRQIWSTSLQLATSTSTFGLWQPLFSFAHIADILGNYSYAKQFVEALLNVHRVDEPEGLAVAGSVGGFHALLMQ